MPEGAVQLFSLARRINCRLANYFDNYLPIHYLIHLPMLLPTQNRPSSIGALPHAVELALIRLLTKLAPYVYHCGARGVPP